MGDIVNFFRETAFPPEATQAMSQAYDMACQALHDTGQPDIVKEILAKRIIRLAGRGELDPQKLCEEALAALGLESPCQSTFPRP